MVSLTDEKTAARRTLQALLGKVHTYLRTYVHAYVHAYVRTCMHTYVRTYMHMKTHREGPRDPLGRGL